MLCFVLWLAVVVVVVWAQQGPSDEWQLLTELNNKLFPQMVGTPGQFSTLPLGQLNVAEECRNRLAPNCKPGGKLPTELMDYNFNTISAEYLGLTGTIPREWASSFSLSNLYLQGNRLTGGVPAWLTNLFEVDLSDNSGLGGSIPAEFAQQYFETLFLRNCSLTGSIPELRVDHLDLSFNRLTGALPRSLASASPWAGLETLDVQHNRLTGPLPENLAPRLTCSLLDPNALLDQRTPPECNCFDYPPPGSVTLRCTQGSFGLANGCLQSIRCDNNVISSFLTTTTILSTTLASSVPATSSSSSSSAIIIPSSAIIIPSPAPSSSSSSSQTGLLVGIILGSIFGTFIVGLALMLAGRALWKMAMRARRSSRSGSRRQHSQRRAPTSFARSNSSAISLGKMSGGGGRSASRSASRRRLQVGGGGNSGGGRSRSGTGSERGSLRRATSSSTVLPPPPPMTTTAKKNTFLRVPSKRIPLPVPLAGPPAPPPGGPPLIYDQVPNDQYLPLPRSATTAAAAAAKAVARAPTTTTTKAVARAPTTNNSSSSGQANDLMKALAGGVTVDASALSSAIKDMVQKK